MSYSVISTPRLLSFVCVNGCGVEIFAFLQPPHPKQSCSCSLVVLFVSFVLSPGYDSYGVPDQDGFRTCCPTVPREHLRSPDPQRFSVHRQRRQRPGTQTHTHVTHKLCGEFK